MNNNDNKLVILKQNYYYYYLLKNACRQFAKHLPHVIFNFAALFAQRLRSVPCLSSVQEGESHG